MARKVVKSTPDQMGYKDRGKMKWQGLILSDHTEAIKKIGKEDASKDPEAKELMSEQEISAVLLQAYLQKAPVNNQANMLHDSHFKADINCILKGVSDNRSILELEDGKVIACLIEDICNVEFADVSEWYEK